MTDIKLVEDELSEFCHKMEDDFFILNEKDEKMPTQDDREVQEAQDRMKHLERMVKSESDERVVNNILRHEYRVLSDDEKSMMKSIKDHGVRFVEACDILGKSRELSLAITKMEEAVMWAVKHITK